MIQIILINKKLYATIIQAIMLILLKLEKNNIAAIKILNKELVEIWEDIKKVLSYQSLLYKLKILYFELISHYNNESLDIYLKNKKTYKLIAIKHYF